MRGLVFRIYSPMVSWGEIAIAEDRGSRTRPNRSAILGILAGSLGIPRTDTEKLSSLYSEISFAVRVDSIGVPLADYHTVQTVKPPKGVRYRSRKHELESVKKKEFIPGFRTYRCDAHYTVIVWNKSEAPVWTLERLKKALGNPVFDIYFGRKCCPPAAPLEPSIVEGGDILELLKEASFSFEIDLPLNKKSFLYSEEQPKNVPYTRTFIVRDDPIGFREFSERKEYEVPLEEEYCHVYE